MAGGGFPPPPAIDPKEPELAKQKDPRIDKRKVTMTTWTTVPVDDGPDGPVKIAKQEAVDYVRPDFLDAYVADARTRWQQVTVSDEPDAGPGGYEGQTAVPAGLDHELAGQVFPAIEKG